jgi:hypothetical protein
VLVRLPVVSDTQSAHGAEGIRATMRRALSLYRAALGLYIALVAIPVLPVGIALVLLAAAAPDPSGSLQRITGIDIAAEFLLVMPLCQGFVAFAVVEQLAGRKPTVRAVLGAVLPRASVLVGTVILSAIAILAGLIALVIPGLVMAIWFQFVGQVVVLEQGSYLNALRRCRELVQGTWWRTTRFLLVIGLTGGVASFVVSTLVSGALSPRDSSARSNLVVPLAANIPSSILVLPFSTIAVTLVYLHLRARRPSA